MPTYEVSISIAAPRENIWRILSDVAAWPRWLPTVTSVEALDSKVLSIGARYIVRQPKLRPATWVVTEIRAPQRFVWLVKSPGLQMLAEHTIEAGAAGVCSVVLKFSFSGFLGGLVGRMFRATTESYLATEAASLKQKTEAQR